MMSNNQVQQTILKDERPLLSIIKLHSADQLLIDALSALIDNNFIKEQQQKLIIKTFISTQKSESDLIKQIKQNLINEQKYLFESCQSLLQQLFDIQKMQLQQQLSHTLLFGSLETVQQNEMHLALQYLQQHSIKSKQKIIKYALINFTSLNFQETKVVQKEYEGKCQQNLLYFEFQRQQNKNQNNFQLNQDKYIINKQGKLNWLDIKDYLKLQLKRRLELSKTQIIILQFFINPQEDQNNDNGILSFDLNCIQKIVNFFKKIASDKLHINLIIKKLNINQSQVLSEVERINQQKILFNLKSFINAIEQGIVNPEKSKNNLLLKSNINEFKQKIKGNINSPSINQEFQRIFNNKLLKLNAKPNIQQNKTYTNKIPIIERNGEIKLIDVFYQNEKLEVTQQSKLIVNYNENVLILFYYNEFKLYYCQNILQKHSIQFEAQLLDISEYKDTQSIQLVKKVIPPNILIQNNIIYLLYGYLGDKLIEFNMNESSILIKNKGYLSNKNNNIIKDSTELRENITYRDGASVSCNKQLFNGSKFAIIGGELGSESKICNIIEQVYINDSNFESGMIVKEKLNSKFSLKPFKDQLILEDNNYLIILPGDYNNQNYKFSQVINPSFYKQAMKLKKINENNYQWENIEIIYSDRLRQKKQQYKCLSKQNNIMKIEDNHWIALINLFDEFPQEQCEEDQYQNILKFDFQLKDQKLIIDYNFITNDNQEDGNSTSY